MPQQQAPSTSLRDSLYLSQDADETTFKYDQELPSLPVPSVKQSVLKLLDTIKPLVDNHEQPGSAFRDVERKALLLLEDPNVGELQELLKKRASEHKNWLEEWWLEFAYLRSRKPLIPYSNMAAPLPIMPYWPLVRKIREAPAGYECVRARRAALSTYFQMCFWRMLRHEQMRPMIHKGVPWSMNQFRYLFNTVRRPGEPKDELVTWFRTAREGPPESTEVIVLYRGYIHAIKPVTMLSPQQACVLSAPQIEQQLRSIEKWCQAQPMDGPGLGVLTTSERSVWKEARDELAGVSEHNKRLLDRIERALSVLVLDDHEPANTQEIFELCLANGETVDRWADKSITSIAFKNGTFGASADHTPYDGFCTGIMTHYLMTSVEECQGEWNDKLGVASNSSWAVRNEPELLDFKLSPQVKVSVLEATAHSKAVCSTIDVLHDTFCHFGKGILKEHRLHPEAFVQCAIHATYFKIHNRMAPAYVTASTRRFHNGRTETCRSCYPEMRDFAQDLRKHQATRPKQTYELLKRSVERFQQLMNEASNGHGCDRHLMGLYLTAILEGKKIPELFDDELVQRTNNYVLSTSCSGYWNVCGGVPPLVEDGYGCFYGIEDSAITFGLTAYKTSKETDLRQFYRNLSETLLEMQRVLLSTKL